MDSRFLNRKVQVLASSHHPTFLDTGFLVGSSYLMPFPSLTSVPEGV